MVKTDFNSFIYGTGVGCLISGFFILLGDFIAIILYSDGPSMVYQLFMGVQALVLCGAGASLLMRGYRPLKRDEKEPSSIKLKAQNKDI